MMKQNLHTHSTYCDGSSTCEEMIKSALKCGFSSLGFSGHAYTPHADYCMTLKKTEEYYAEIAKLKKKYEKDIIIYTGIEYDCYSDCDTSPCEYIIGSAHEIFKDGLYLSVDYTADDTRSHIKNHFGGNPDEYIKAYFETVKKVPERTRCDILGHIDLVTKFSDTITEIDPESDIYLTYAFDAVKSVSEKVKVFEVNTGAISRGYRTTPYPSLTLLKEMKRCGMMPVISSDCHKAEDIDCAYDIAAKLVKNAGYTEILLFNGTEFVGTSV